jgi:hypothetical protein
MVSASSKQDSQIWFWVASALLLSTFLGDLLICPHSKVEESFQLQATHDLFYHGIIPAVRSFVLGENNVTLPYDHLHYPGGTLLRLAKDSIFAAVALVLTSLLYQSFLEHLLVQSS